METTEVPSCSKTDESVICAVKGCGSSPRTHSALKFHEFPKSGARFVYVKNASNKSERVDQREAWLRAMNETDVPSSAMLCSRHFEEEDYLTGSEEEGPSRRKRLKSTVVPSNNLHDNLHEQKSKGNFEFVNIKVEPMDIEDSEENNEMTDNEQTSVMKNYADCNNAASNNSSSNDCDVKPTLQSINIERCSVERENRIIVNRPEVKDAEVQVETTEIFTCFSHLKKDSDVKIVTGLQSLASLNEIVDKVDSANNKKYEIPGRQFRTFDRVLLTYVKLKHDLPHDVLAILFQCSKEDSESIFSETEETLKNCNLL